MWCAYLVVFLSRLCVGPLAPYLKQVFDLSNAQVGGLTSATAVAYAPTLVFAGWLVDRIGVRCALLIGTVVTGLCIGAVALAPSYGAVLMLLGASGLGCGFIYPTAVRAIMLWFPPNERATAVGVNQSAINVSGMIGAALMPWLAIEYDWRAGFVFAAVLAFAVAVVAMVFYRDPPRGWSQLVDTRLRAADEMDQDLPTAEGDMQAYRRMLKCAFGPVLRSRDLLVMGLTALFLGTVEFAALSQLVLFLTSDWGYSVAVAAALLALTQFAGAIGKPMSGLVSDRLLKGRRVPALLGMAVIAGLSCIAIALVQPGHEWLLWCAIFAFGFGAVGWGGLMGAIAGETGGFRSAGAAAGVVAAFSNMGALLGPPLFGAIVDATGSYSMAWWGLAASSAAALMTLLLITEG